MGAQVYSVPDQTEGRRNVFLEWISIDLSPERSGYLTVLLASDFYFIFLCCGITLKIELSCKFPAEFCNLRWIR